MVAETHLTPANLVLPLFVKQAGESNSVDTQPTAGNASTAKNASTLKGGLTSKGGLTVYPLTKLAAIGEQAAKQGIGAVAIFPQVPTHLKDAKGTQATKANNLVCRSIQLLKKELPELPVIADVALDPYTSHGQDGVLDKTIGNVDNDATVSRLVKQALTLAKAGADAIAPSDMMDGRIAAIRTALDKNRMPYLPIISYTAKYASCLYKPFRDAVGSTKMLKGDKKSYQLNPANLKEAIRQAEADIAQGADILMVKPAQFYLDVVKTFSQTFSHPIAAYQVSGEYEMLCRSSANFEELVMESLIAIRRAGATVIFSYASLEAARMLNNARTTG